MFALFLCYSLVQAPIPGINEPHYLCKAKRFWDSAYCPGDFFLDSSNTHFVFYVAVGWLTKFLTLSQTAFVGRVAAYGLLAAGWTVLVRQLVPRAGSAALAAALFLGWTSAQIELFHANGFSGEWIVGGVESKVFAWGLLFWSLARLARGSRFSAAILAGLAISFHPVVGVWGGLGLLVAAVALRKETTLGLGSVRNWLAPVALLILAALPGLIPAIAALMQSVPDAAEADRIQVFKRLGHHLDPARIPPRIYALYGGLTLAWLAAVLWLRIARRRSQNPHNRIAQATWFWFVLTSVVVALVGIGVGMLQFADLPLAAKNLAVKLMKFYPFRLFDVLIPVAVLVAVTEVFLWPQKTAAVRAAVLTLIGAAAFAVGLSADLGSRNPERFAESQEADWIDVCRWIDRHAPPDAIVVVPMGELTFKWYASRATYVTYKDAPQDAAGLLEWYRHRKLLIDWAQRSYFDEQFSRQELAELGRLTGATYLIARRLGPIDQDWVYRNRWYRVYKLSE